MKARRILARLYAVCFGYSWIPCPACGRKFGGHEWATVDGHFDVTPIGDQRGSTTRAQGICPACTGTGAGCYAFAAWDVYHVGCCFVEPDARDTRVDRFKTPGSAPRATSSRAWG